MIKLITLQNILHAPDMTNNLVSLSCTTNSGLKIIMEKDDLKIHSPKGEILGIGKKVRRLYKLDLSSRDEAYISKAGCTWDEWHQIFGHMYVGSVQLLKQKNMVEGMEVVNLIAPSQQCTPSISAKQHHTPFPRSTNESAQEIGELTVPMSGDQPESNQFKGTPTTFHLLM